MGCPTLNQRETGWLWLCPPSLHPPVALHAWTATTPRGGAGIASPVRKTLPRRPKVCRPQAFLTASPSHPPRLPRLPFTGAALLAPGPGACAWVETASRWSYFFTFLGGRGGRFGKKLPGPGKQREGDCLKGVWLAWPRFCTEWGLGRETEARSIPPGQCRG